MTRWLLALLFAFGSVTFLSACEEKSDAEKAGDAVKEGADEAADKAKEGADDAADKLKDATE